MGLIDWFLPKDRDRSFTYDILTGETNFGNNTLINSVLLNPAVLKVFALQCDLFSLGQIRVKDVDGNEIEDDPFLALIKNPNPFEEEIGRASCRERV